MATFIYDGKSNLTAAQTDTVVITADPTLFTQASQNLNDAVLRFGTNTLTITGATLTNTSLSNVTLAGGNFVIGTAGTGVANTAANSLVIATDNVNTGVYVTGATTAASKNAFFGGNGISSPNDLGDSVQVGGQGSFLVYGNGGDDVIRQGTTGVNGTAFDSTSAVTVFGGKGGDVVNLSNTGNAKASMLILGGESTDSISVFNTGNTTIFGGLGAGDSTDGADKIAIVGVSGGTINVFGNGGNDVISGTLGDSTAATTFANGTVANVFGGTGSDSINIGFDAATTAKGTVTVYGGEDSDFIRVVNTGTTTIYGGTGQGDSTDGNDSIALGGSGGTITVFGNAGADIISGDGTNAGTPATATAFAEGTSATVYGGKGSDSINLGFTGTAKGTLAVYGGEDTDTITVANGVGGSTTVFGGTGQGDSADGADTINIGGSGAVNVFGNGGNDTINLGNYVGGTASTNVVTVYAGAGNDSINVANLVNGQSTLVLNGNEGADTFSFVGTAANTTAGNGFGVSIADFTIGTDKLVVENGAATGGAATITTVPTGGFADLQAALNAASQGAANTVATVVFGGSAYVVVNTGAAGFDPNADLAIKLTGITDANAAANAVTVV